MNRKSIIFALLTLFLIGGTSFGGYKVYTDHKRQLQEKDQKITELFKPQCDQQVATFKAVAVGTSTERVHAGTFEVLTPEAQKGQRLDAFIFYPFEVGDTITQCMNVVVSKP